MWYVMACVALTAAADEVKVNAARAADDAYVSELLTILDETNSADAFAVTLELLADTRSDLRRQVPRVLRNAERLGLFANHLTEPESQKAEMAGELAEVIVRMAKGGKKPAAKGAKKSATRPARRVEVVPVPPWQAPRMEEKYVEQAEYRTPILPAVRDGFPPPICEDAPSEQEVLRLLPRTKNIPQVYEEQRDDIQIVSERLVDKIDPPRFFPLVGVARLHHCHWKCTVSYTETIRSAYPFPVELKKPRTQVVYIDKDHLHLGEAH